MYRCDTDLVERHVINLILQRKQMKHFGIQARARCFTKKVFLILRKGFNNTQVVEK